MRKARIRSKALIFATLIIFMTEKKKRKQNRTSSGKKKNGKAVRSENSAIGRFLLKLMAAGVLVAGSAVFFTVYLGVLG
jgi:hypothetical protein